MNRMLGKPRRRWEDSMTVVLRETWYDVRDLIQDRDKWRSLLKTETSNYIKSTRVSSLSEKLQAFQEGF